MRKINLRALTSIAMLTALSVVFTRIFVLVNTDTLRLTIGNVPIMLCGIFFGPVAGGICGVLSDFLGCILFGGYMPYLPMTLSLLVIGVLPGIAAKLVKRRSNMSIANPVVLCATVFVTELIASFFWKTMCLSWMYSSPFFALFYERLLVNVIQSVLEVALLFLLLKSGVLVKLFSSDRSEKNGQ